MAQIKFRTSGGAWQAPKEIKTWDGSQWRRRTGYRWTGATWDPIITYRHDIITNGNTPYTFEDVGSEGFNYHGYESGAYVTYAHDTGSGGWLYLRTTTDINVTYYSTLYVDLRYVNSISGSVGVKTSGMASWEWSARHHESTETLRKTVAIDVSSLSGWFRFAVNADADTDTSGSINIYNAWLE